MSSSVGGRLEISIHFRVQTYMRYCTATERPALRLEIETVATRATLTGVTAADNQERENSVSQAGAMADAALSSHRPRSEDTRGCLSWWAVPFCLFLGLGISPQRCGYSERR